MTRWRRSRCSQPISSRSGFLPFAVTGASFHLLPVMLRNDIRHPRRLQVALPLLGGGFLVAPGVAFGRSLLLWPGATLLTAGLALVLWELLALVQWAPKGRTLIVSRVGVALASFHAAAALVLGALVFSRGDAAVAGVVHGRWLLVHLHLAVVGWLTLLIVTVGRTLAPMLAQAPVAPARRFPLSELALTGGLWTLLAGLAASSRPATLAGGCAILLTLAQFARLLMRVARSRRLELEAPLAHLLAGVLFLLQAAALGTAILVGAVAPRTGLTAYVVLLLLGWAGGVTLGHLRETALAVALGLVAARATPEAERALSAPRLARRGRAVRNRRRAARRRRLRGQRGPRAGGGGPPAAAAAAPGGRGGGGGARAGPRGGGGVGAANDEETRYRF